MFNSFLRYFLYLFLLIFITNTMVFAAPSNDPAGAKSTLDGLQNTAEKAYGSVEQGIITDIPNAIGKIVGAALAFVGVLFLLLMIYGGFTWMVARGNEQEVTKAKDMITAAVIGLVIVLSAYAITAYIGDQLLGGQSTQQ